MVQIIVGTMGTSPLVLSKNMSDAEKMRSFLEICSEYNVKQIDTARVYANGRNEELLGEISASKNSQIETKIGITPTASLGRDNIINSVHPSLKALKVDSVDILYIHAPDRDTPLEETLSAFDDLYKLGKYQRFGICSYREDEVKEIYNLCKEKGFIKPGVYQGNFNVISRRPQKELLPTLKQLDMVFYGFGSLAGGALFKDVAKLKEANTESRFGALPFLKGAYLQDKMIDAIAQWQKVCAEHNLLPLNATLRWLQYHSGLGEKDGIILGASSVEQIQGNLKGLEGGPLHQNLIVAFDKMWEQVESEAAPYHK